MYIPTTSDLLQIEATVSPRHGWDFSSMQTRREAVPWEYMEVVPHYLKSSDRVLDIGTGGGEKLMALSVYFWQGVGIDPDPEMIRAAQENGLGQSKMTFANMAAESLEFPDEYFDVVLNRHAPIHISEVVRVLRPGGYVVTQQVGAQNMGNIRDEFGTGRAVRHANPDGLADEAFQRLNEGFAGQGCRLLASAAYNVRYWVKDLPSLIFWFKALAGGNEVPAGFSIERDGPTVRRIIEKYSTAEGIVTNEHRTLLIAHKPS